MRNGFFLLDDILSVLQYSAAHLTLKLFLIIQMENPDRMSFLKRESETIGPNEMKFLDTFV